MIDDVALALETSLSTARAMRDAARTEFEKAQAVVRGLEVLQNAHRAGGGAGAPTPIKPIKRMQRSDAILAVLQDVSPRRVQTADIVKGLHGMGRTDDAVAVNRSLGALQRQQRIYTPGRLQGWCLYEDRPGVDADADATSGDTVASHLHAYRAAGDS